MDDFEIHFEKMRLSVAATAAIEEAMERAGLTRAELASKIGVPRSRVTKVLDGETNMTLKTLAQFGLACGVRWQFVGVQADECTNVVIAPESLKSSVARAQYQIWHPPFVWIQSHKQEERELAEGAGDSDPNEPTLLAG